MSAPVSGAPVDMVPRIEPEDRMRADFYALFARLLFAAPDAELLQMMGSAPLIEPEADIETAATPLAIAWARLSAASRVMDVDAAADEYDALFGGIGRSEISLFAAYYAGPDAPGAGANFLVDLRAALIELDVALQTGQNTPEDHFSALFETMRLLIHGNGELAPHDLETQSRFFRRFIAPCASDCCTAIAKCRLANFYKLVAECISTFVAIEKQSYEIA